MVFTPDCATALEEMGDVVAHWGSRAPDELVEQHLADMVILIGQTAMPKERLDRAPNLRAILNVKANWEPNIDYEECNARGIHVLSAAPAMAPAVAEYCIGQAIMLLRGLHKADKLFRAGLESYGIAGNQDAKSLYNADVALVGYGNLGRSLASRAEIVEFDDFLELAADGKFRAAIDIFPEEPVPEDSPYRTVPNVLFSSHLAGGLNASYGRIRETMLDDINQILKGLSPLRMQKANPKQAAKMRSR
ncbi:MAG: NAD(P)-dependent oxidoreductase [Pseudomonadales bacterium]